MSKGFGLAGPVGVRICDRWVVSPTIFSGWGFVLQVIGQAQRCPCYSNCYLQIAIQKGILARALMIVFWSY